MRIGRLILRTVGKRALVTRPLYFVYIRPLVVCFSVVRLFVSPAGNRVGGDVV